MIEAIGAAEARPFSWADGGCAGMVLDCVKAVRGSAPVEAPCLNGAGGVARWLKGRGHASIAEAFAAHFEEIPVAMAGRGDIGIAERDGRQTAVVCAGVHWAGKSETGVLRVSRGEIIRAFKV